MERLGSPRLIAAAVAAFSVLAAASEAADNLAVTGRTTTVIFVGSEGRIRRSTDSGLTSDAVSGGPSAAVALRDVTDTGQSFVAVGDAGTIAYSNLVGSTWNVAASPAAVTLRAVNKIGSSLVAAGDAGTILQTFTLNGSANWQEVPVASGVEVALYDVGPSTSRSYAVGAGGTIVQGNLLGNSFPAVIQNVPTSADLRGFILFRANTLIAVGEGGTILRSTDDGLHWQLLSSPIASDLYGIAMSGDGGYVVAGGEGGALIWSNDGLQWQLSGASPLRADLYGAGYVGGYFFLVGGSNLVARALPTSVGQSGGWNYTSVKPLSWGALKQVYGARR